MNRARCGSLKSPILLGYWPSFCPSPIRTFVLGRLRVLFMVARQDVIVSKAHVCLTCFELAQAMVPDTESVSLQDYNETIEARPLAPA